LNNFANRWSGHTPTHYQHRVQETDVDLGPPGVPQHTGEDLLLGAGDGGGEGRGQELHPRDTGGTLSLSHSLIHLVDRLNI